MPWISPQWLAGFFDGEGCVNIVEVGPAKGRKRCTFRLYITNTDYDLLAEIQKQYGGQLVRRQNNKPGWKPFCSLVFTYRQADFLLSKIDEFIILKRRQIDLAKEFLALRDDPMRYEIFDSTGVPSSKHPYVKRVRKEIISKEYEIKAKMHVLNKKGSDAIQ